MPHPTTPDDQLWLGLIQASLRQVRAALAGGACVHSVCGARQLSDHAWQPAYYYPNDTPLHGAVKPRLDVSVSQHQRRKNARNIQAICELLLEHGASLTRLNEAGETPLIAAVKSARLQGRQLAKLISPTEPCLDVADRKNSYTALHLACQQGDLALVKLLTSKGANLEVRNRFGDTPLWEIARTLSENYDPNPAINQLIAAHLLKEGARADILDPMGNTLIMALPRLPLKEWTKHGADPAHVRADGFTYLGVLMEKLERRKDYAMDNLCALMEFPGIDWIHTRTNQNRSALDVIEDALSQFEHSEQAATLGRFVRAQVDGAVLDTTRQPTQPAARRRL